MMQAAVVTSIQAPTPSLIALAVATAKSSMTLHVIGDRKSPTSFELPGARFFSLAEQGSLPFDLAPLLPENHYARKNLGYLTAIAAGAEAIFDTDDDNRPLPAWRLRAEHCDARALCHRGWVNAYGYFTSTPIWPRGLPLEAVRGRLPSLESSSGARLRAPIQQGLADGSPDVDAIWRLLMDDSIEFDRAPSVYLRPGAWCPFNSQATWWFPLAYPLLYLPSYVSFRMTDIWRSFVAQRCLWALDLGIVFHAAEMHQDRNEHNLLRDFEQEVPGYLNNARIAALLDALTLSERAQDLGYNLRRCYEALVVQSFVPPQELALIDAWLRDLKRLVTGRAAL